jgi:class 3 adenylate cyclase
LGCHSHDGLSIRSGRPTRVEGAGSGAHELKDFEYRFELDLASSPEQLWPLVADTNRFNRDAGLPPVDELGIGENARRRLRLRRLGLTVEWEEEPFEWVRPHRFSVVRRYMRGPLTSMTTSATLSSRAGGGTRLVYTIRARPRNPLGWLVIPLQIGVLSRRRFAEVIRAYDGGLPATAPRARLEPGGKQRIAAARDALGGGELAARLCDLVERGDELSVQSVRPYVLADAWHADRRQTLELCLLATRQGLLELRWELLCPLCRGTAGRGETLDAVAGTMHCETCRIDVHADFDRSVEIVFRPAPAIRQVAQTDFCVAGPEVTPHVAAQQLVPAGERRTLALELEPGRHRLRTLGSSVSTAVTVATGGTADAVVALEAGGELRLAETASLTVENTTDRDRLAILERTAWSDRSATATEVTALQTFRDLFAAEALRPGEPISVGTVTVVFTDLRGSTRYYRDVGDAIAFGSVLEHIDLLRDEVSEQGGAVVKAMGDAIMAVFSRPLSALDAMRSAQERVAGKPLALKVGVHTGPSVAVNQNGRLDYFGSTVNLAARLVALSSGDDIVVTDTVLCDPEVAERAFAAERVEATPKGFEGETLALWRVLP